MNLRNTLPVRVEKIFRHPIKSISREEITQIKLERRKALPLDRMWALVHEKSSFDELSNEWQPCTKFLRGSIMPTLSAVESIRTDDQKYTFKHPDLKPISLDLSDHTDRETFVNWLLPICSDKFPKPTKLVCVDDTALTDTPFQSISINSLDSLEDLSEKAGISLEPERFRGNIWIRTGKPWTEFDWVGELIKIDEVELKVVDRIERCNATKTNTKTGQHNCDTIGILNERFGHQDFGVYCSVRTPGTVRINSVLSLNKME